ncbi:MAG: hypothetical protein EHM34_00135 [Nitrosopumilales archaeon]|nr:MAG: hypothetical protein EHM34_00135 [Nitrosopumilales archaeon]
MRRSPVKKIEPDQMRELLKNIKALSQEAKKPDTKPNYDSVTSKEVLFYFLAQFADLETRVTKIETTQTCLMWFMGIALAIVGVVIVL